MGRECQRYCLPDATANTADGSTLADEAIGAADGGNGFHCESRSGGGKGRCSFLKKRTKKLLPIWFGVVATGAENSRAAAGPV
jgi:hypothetical protein